MITGKTFMQAVQLPEPEIDVVHCALLIAAQLQPGLDIAQSTKAIGELVEKACGEIGSAHELLEYLYDQHRFRGNGDDYYNADNSLLNRVLETRTGIPISLALVYIAVGRRLGLNVNGISFPGHFLIGIEEQHGTLMIDVFAGRVVTRDDCYRLIEKLYQRKVSPDDSYFAPANNQQIVLRVLENLKGIYLKSGRGAEALTCLDCQLMVMPENAAFLEQQQGVLAHLQKRGGDSAPPVH